ncbi:MAG: hypothetical protein JW832_07050 [Deltaproteobacteria bacterium]|nr:hypothetical protein [Deltaproteobacteria bacterium]
MAAMSEELKVLNDKVMRYLREMDLNFEVRGDFYRLEKGSTAVILHPCQWGDDKTFLKVLGIVLSKVAKGGNEAMFEEFSEINNKGIIGKIYWEASSDDPNIGAIYYEHCLLGEFLDFEEFKSALLITAFASDELDDKLQAKYGGERYSD